MIKPRPRRIDVLTIFPEYLEPLSFSLLGKAQEKGLLRLGIHDLREFTHDVHRSVDDSPYGGGPGMVMTAPVWGSAIDAVLGSDTAPAGELDALATDALATDALATDALATAGPATAAPRRILVVPTPVGKPFTQADAQRWAAADHLVFLCGRYEGIDQRVVDEYSEREQLEEVSLGDFVLIGGEVATMAMIEAVVRLVPGVLGNQRSHEEDTFSDGLLEAPAYTRPPQWRGREVPEVLLSGNHALVDQWRREQSLRRTAARRPDLIARADLSGPDRELLESVRSEAD